MPHKCKRRNNNFWSWVRGIPGTVKSRFGNKSQLNYVGVNTKLLPYCINASQFYNKSQICYNTPSPTPYAPRPVTAIPLPSSTTIPSWRPPTGRRSTEPSWTGGCTPRGCGWSDPRRRGRRTRRRGRGSRRRRRRKRRCGWRRRRLAGSSSTSSDTSVSETLATLQFWQLCSSGNSVSHLAADL